MEDGEEWVHNSHVHPSLEVRKAINGRGMFVKAGHHITKDEVLVVWTGRIVNHEEVKRLQPPDDDYFLQIYDDLFQIPFVLGKREPAVSGVQNSLLFLIQIILTTNNTLLPKQDFVNHSCEPSGGLRGEAVLVAMRDIKEGEEITFDYATTECIDGEWECLCGTPACRGTIRGTDWKLLSLQERYGEYWSLFLLRKIKGLDQAK